MRVAITGGIGEGKSTILAMLAEMGYATLSADAVARDVFSRPEVQDELAEIAGLARPVVPSELRAALAGSEDVRRRVNAAMHPRVMEDLSGHESAFVEVPLLFEACLQSTFDQVWVATCGAREQRRRLMQRYGDRPHVESLLATQLPSRAKIPFADLVIRTNCPLDHVRRLLSAAAGELVV